MTNTPPTGNPAEPTRPIPMTPTQPPPAAPGPPPGPPSGPPATPAPAPGAPPRKSGGGLLLIGFIAVSVLLIVALAFAIFSFVGKSDESDKKDKAQKELTSAKKQLADTKAQLGTSEAAGGLLGDLLTTGAKSADDLKACADSARQLRSNIVAALNAVQAGGSINPLVDGINTQITDNDTKCGASDTSYQGFLDALRKLQTGSR